MALKAGYPEQVDKLAALFNNLVEQVFCEKFRLNRPCIIDIELYEQVVEIINWYDYNQ